MFARYHLPMSLNIKNPRVHELARRAAEVIGTTQVGAVEEALVRLLREYGNDPERAAIQQRYDLARQIVFAYSSDPGMTPRDIVTVEDLYDETGLPK